MHGQFPLCTYGKTFKILSSEIEIIWQKKSLTDPLQKELFFRLKHGIGADLFVFMLYLCYRKTVS